MPPEERTGEPSHHLGSLSCVGQAHLAVLGVFSPHTSYWLQGGARKVPISASPVAVFLSLELAAVPPLGAVQCLS